MIFALLLVAAAIPLGPAPAAVRHECAQRADYSSFRTTCPTRWPIRRGSATRLDAAIVRGPSQWIASFDDPAFGPPDGGHVMIGGQKPAFSLVGDVGETWPRAGEALPLPLLHLPTMSVVARATAFGRPSLVLVAPPYPDGGMNGDHVVVLLNVEGHGAFVSLHLGGYTQAQRIAAALAVASSWR